MKTEYLNNKVFEDAILRFKKSKQEKSRYDLILEDVRESMVKREKHNKKPHHDIKVYILEYERSSKDFVQAQKDLANSFYALSENLVRYAKDIIVDQDDAIQEGVMICFEKIDRFNPDWGKAFNYMTTCILNHFRQIWRTHKNYKLLKEKFRDFQISRLSNVFRKNGKEIHSNDSFGD